MLSPFFQRRQDSGSNLGEKRGNSNQESVTSSQSNKLLIKHLLALLKIVILTFVLVWLSMLLRKSWQDIVQYNWRIQYRWLFLSGIFYIVAFIPSAFFWYLSLRWLGQSPKLWQAFKAFYFSQLGKYIPGKALVVLIRSDMISGPKVRTSIAAACVFYETLMMMGIGAFIAAIIVLCYFRQHIIFSCMALGVSVVSLLPLTPPLFVRLLKILHIGKGDPQVQQSLQNLRYKNLLAGMVLMIFLWLGFGLSLWSAIQGLGISTPPLYLSLPRYVCIVALAMTLGFAVPISPGGLGIREAVISALLLPYLSSILNEPSNAHWSITPDSLAAIVALIQRITSIIAEVAVVAFFFGTTLLHKLSHIQK